MHTTLQDIYEAVVNGKKGNVVEYVKKALNEDIQPSEILNQGLIAAMKEVGDLYEAGDLFVPEMMIAAKSMKTGLALLDPYLVGEKIESSGIVILGTVKGDLHDIGKNLVGMMLEGSGFEVIDLGADVPPEKFAETALDYKAHIVGMSALLTTTMQNMRSTIEVFEDLGIRNDVKIMVGGAPVTEIFAKDIGADGYAPDAGRALKLAKALI
jgi:5-methyltetrahydrofolate--homocysteine methyltransferase